MAPAPSCRVSVWPPTVEPLAMSISPSPVPAAPRPRGAPAPVSAGTPVSGRPASGEGGVVQLPDEVAGGVDDCDGARVAQLVVPEPTGADDDRRHPRVLGRLDVVDRVAHRHARGVGRLAQLLQ